MVPMNDLMSLRSFISRPLNKQRRTNTINPRFTSTAGDHRCNQVANVDKSRLTNRTVMWKTMMETIQDGTAAAWP